MKILIYLCCIILVTSCKVNETPIKEKTNKIEVHNSQNNDIEDQLETVEKLRLYMDHKQYDKAIALFSNEQQKNIKEIQKDKSIFKYWCMAWTLDAAKHERYIKRIKANQGDFIFENGAWKINEK